MHDLMKKSLVSFGDLKKEAMKALEAGSESSVDVDLSREAMKDLEAGPESSVDVDFNKEAMKDLEAGPDYSVEMTNAANLVQFLEEAENIKTEMASIHDVVEKLQDANEESKSLHKPEPVKALSNRINGDILTVLKKARAIRSKIEEMDRANERLSGYMDFLELRQKMMSEHREMVGRRYFTVTGQNPNEDVIEKIVTNWEDGGEDYLQSAIQEQRRLEIIVEIKDRHGPSEEIEKSLLELHQVSKKHEHTVCDVSVKKASCFQGLPTEIEDAIVERVKGIKCLTRCKVVCKNWYNRICSFVDPECFLEYNPNSGLFTILSGERRIKVPQPSLCENENSYDAALKLKMIAAKDGTVTLVNLPYIFHWKPCSGYLVKSRTPFMTEDIALGIGFCPESPGLKVLIVESLQRDGDVVFFTAYCFGNKTWEPRSSRNPLPDGYTIIGGVDSPDERGNFYWVVRGTEGSLSILRYNFCNNLFFSFDGPPNHSLESLPDLHFRGNNLEWSGYTRNRRLQHHVRRDNIWELRMDSGYLPHPSMELGVGSPLQIIKFTMNERELEATILEKGEKIEVSRRIKGKMFSMN